MNTIKIPLHTYYLLTMVNYIMTVYTTGTPKTKTNNRVLCKSRASNENETMEIKNVQLISDTTHQYFDEVVFYVQLMHLVPVPFQIFGKFR